MSDNVLDKRREIRYPICKRVEYVLSDSPDQVFHGLATNISKHGICLNLYHELDEGTSIIIRNDLENYCNKATIRWIVQIRNGIYQAGLVCGEYL